ncbi:MAG TPA: hypothetical protein VLG44_00670 [Chlamydiales bacterium]|nr:hypothetical protein [Chlamydiales bacterium]
MDHRDKAMNLEEKIAAYKEIVKKIDELEEEKKELGKAIMQEMQGKTMQVANFMVRKYSRLLIKIPLEKARILGAVKMEEAVDKEKIKALYQLDKSIEGVSEIQYIQISDTSKPV